MEALMLISYYDERWFFMGLLQRFRIFSLHKDSCYSSTIFFLSYIQLQFIGYAIYLNKDNVKYWKGVQPSSNPLDDGPQGGIQDSQPVNLLLVPFSNQLTAMIQLTVIKVILSFILGMKIRYAEEKWWKDVFFQKDAIQGAIFTEDQKHSMMSFDLRRKIFHGDFLDRPFTRVGHWLFIISLMTAFLFVVQVDDPMVYPAFLMEQICLYIIIFEFITVLGFRIPTLIFCHVPYLSSFLHNIKIAESQLTRAVFPTKIQRIEIKRQPYVQGGMIRCGDPTCKMMHKAGDLNKKGAVSKSSKAKADKKKKN